MSRPRVSVLTATHNSASFLDGTIRSVLDQTFGDFEYLIIDDASSDDSLQIAAQHARLDHRIRIIANQDRAGPAGALNLALHQAQGDYVAILDHDDLALPERLSRQVAFMDLNPDYGALGSAVRHIDAEGRTQRDQLYPTHPDATRWQLLFGASLLHSASIYRRQLVQGLGGYSRRHHYLCDYELLIRIAERACIGNLPEVLACYRRHERQTSAIHFRVQNGQMQLLQYALQTRWLGKRPNLAIFSATRQWMFGNIPVDPDIAHAVVDSFKQLFSDYVGLTPLEPEGRRVIALDCARLWARMAHHAYRVLPDVSRLCWREARRLAPEPADALHLRHWMRKSPGKRARGADSPIAVDHQA